jgi:hypothetical protein
MIKTPQVFAWGVFYFTIEINKLTLYKKNGKIFIENEK